jgi:hypothetical protein
MAKSRAVHPILGARRQDQLLDNLGAIGVVLPEEAVTRLQQAQPFEVGFPTDFSNDVRGWVFGEANQRLDHIS